jgi:hypothetical protein
MTVSKALRDAPDVSAATKSRIKALAQQMGYVPDSSAQGLRSQTSKLFGLVIPVHHQPHFRAHRLCHRRTRARTRLRHPARPHAQHSGTRGIRHPPPALAPRGRTVHLAGLSFEAEAKVYQELLATPDADVLLGPPAPFCKSFVSIEIEELVASYNARSISSSSATNALPISPARRSRRGRTNVSRATAARCARPIWKWTTSSFSRPAAPLRTAPRPRCKC